jgi:hypothetical protein
MTEQEQRIAIAEACGWYDIGEPTWNKRVLGMLGQGPLRNIPDYLNDLNAMHDAEKMIQKNADHVFDYMDNLEQVTSFVPHFATAAQRAEAFLRTLNLWKQ